ncbi:MAG: hypothetical protein ACJZ66_03395 [Parvibaculales bacterium]
MTNYSEEKAHKSNLLVLNVHTCVLSYIFLILPFFDMLNGLLVVRGYLPEGFLGSPSQISRLFAIILLLGVNFSKRIPHFYLMIFMLLLVIETIAAFYHQKIVGLLFGYVTVSKVLYMYLLFITLRRYAFNHLEDICKFLKFNVNLISGSIVFGYITGLGNSTYGWGTGTKGFFSSGNGLGIYIGVAAIVLVALRHYRFYQHTNMLTIVLSGLALILVGTKTSLILFILLFITVVLQLRLRLLVLPALLGFFIYVWDFLVFSVNMFFDIIISRYEKSESLLQYLFSYRDIYVRDAFSQFFQQDIGPLRWLFGAGSYVSFQNPRQVYFYDTLETDMVDLLFMYGIIGVTAYLIIIFYGLVLHFNRPIMFLGFLMLSLHSIIAGHVLFNGMSSTLFIILFVFGVAIKSNYDVKKRNLIITQ